MHTSVIIPTYRRPNDLPRLFGSLSVQLIKPAELLVIVGPGDHESLRICSAWDIKLPGLKIFKAKKPSVVHSLNLGLSEAKGEIICLLDDDVWLPPDWLLKIKTAFETDNQLGAFGGRDHLQLVNRNLSNPPLARDVGIFKWNGHKGNHHCGSQKSPVKIDVIKGVNLSFRRSAFNSMQIDPALEGEGAETCWEIDICQKIILAGYYCLYDNNNYVFHFWSPRVGFDNRTDVFSPAWPKRIFNEALTMTKFRPLTELVIWALRLFCIGTRNQPGIVWSFLLVSKRGFRILSLPWRNLNFIRQGMMSGFKNREVVVYKLNTK
jgi:glycosyltransferase involved in cell wall biosynthesis